MEKDKNVDIKKVIKKIKNLMDLAGNNPNENEAIAASLKAQELLAKYKISLTDTEGDFREQEIITAEANLRSDSGKKWKAYLAPIIAKAFYVKNYRCGHRIFFYGYSKDVEIATKVYQTLFVIGNKGARQIYYKCRKEGKPTKGVMNAYLVGFVEGVREALEKQSTALMVITPREVEQGFIEWGKAHGTKERAITIKHSSNSKIKEKGRFDGRSSVEKRTIEQKK